MLVNRDILPTPIAVAQSFVENFSEIARHFIASGLRVLVSIIIAVALAVPAGLGMGQIPRLNRIFSPLVYIAYPIPKIVFFPIILLFFGATEFSKILIIVLILFFQILVPVRDDSLNLRPELLNSVKSLGAGRRALFRFVYVPSRVSDRVDGGAPERGHGGGGVVFHRGDGHVSGPGLLHLLDVRHAVRLCGDVRRGDCDGLVGVVPLLPHRLAGKAAVPVEICNLIDTVVEASPCLDEQA